MLVRKITLEDAEDFCSCANDDSVHRHVKGFWCDNPEDAKRIIKERLLSPPNVTAYAIIDDTNDSNIFVGVFVVVEKGEINGKQEIELSCFINKKYRGKNFPGTSNSYADQSLRKILDIYKDYRVIFSIDADNTRALRQILKFNPKELDRNRYIYEYNCGERKYSIEER